MGEMHILDCVGVPEYFVTHVGAMEDAGNGMIRIIRCIERKGVLIPVFTAVSPALAILRDGPILRDMVQRVACGAIKADDRSVLQ